jgi:mono/diheme cytochrome c family protein
MIKGRLLELSLIAVVTTVLFLSYLIIAESKGLKVRADKWEGKEIEKGAALYHQHCKSCHGMRGEGVGQLGPALSDAQFFERRLGEVGYQSTLRNYILATAEQGRMMGTRPYYAGNGSTMVMPPWHQKYGGPLRSDELDSITAYILNWGTTAKGLVELVELELPKIVPGDLQTIERGENVFMANCSRCHGLDKINNTQAVGPDLSDISTIAGSRREGLDGEEYIRESVLIPAKYVVEGFEAVASKHSCGAVLTETELTALSVYLLQ